MKFIAENETNVLNSIRIFGKFNIDNYNFYNDTTFAIEDYICPNIDHELMYKCLNVDQQLVVDGGEPPLTGIIVDFSQNKRLINHNNHLQESIVNMTIHESKELIDQSNNRKKFEELIQREVDVVETVMDDNDNNEEDAGDVSIANLLINNLQQELEQNQQQQITSKVIGKKPKRKIKIQNYNGTINLKNISNLTINTSCNRAETPIVKHHRETKSQKLAEATSLSDSLTSSTSGSSITSSTVAALPIGSDDNEAEVHNSTTSYNCEFYNRLLSEIKHSFSVNQSQSIPSSKERNSILFTTSSASSTPSSSDPSIGTSSTCTSISSATPVVETNPTGGSCNKMLFRNIRNLRISIPAVAIKNQKDSNLQSSLVTTTSMDHEDDDIDGECGGGSGSQKMDLDEDFGSTPPVQVEEWLKQIILETEIEPMQNTDILEHSIIKKNKNNCINATSTVATNTSN